MKTLPTNHFELTVPDLYPVWVNGTHKPSRYIHLFRKHLGTSAFERLVLPVRPKQNANFIRFIYFKVKF